MPPPQPEFVYVYETGQVSLMWDKPGADQYGFNDWLATACEHGGQLVSHRLGNFARIAFLRELFSGSPEKFPIILCKVLYDGLHAGDSLELEAVERLAVEMDTVKALHCAKPEEEEMLREFQSQMAELVQAARKVRKPIVF